MSRFAKIVKDNEKNDKSEEDTKWSSIQAENQFTFTKYASYLDEIFIMTNIAFNNLNQKAFKSLKSFYLSDKFKDSIPKVSNLKSLEKKLINYYKKIGQKQSDNKLIIKKSETHYDEKK